MIRRPPVESVSAHEPLAAELRAISQNSNSAVFGVNLDGEITSWSPGAQQMYDYAAERIVGKPYSELILPARIGELRKALEKIKRGRRVPEIQTQRRCSNGRVMDVTFSIFPVRDAKNEKVVGAVALERDITDRRETERALEDSAAQIHAIVRTAVDGIITIDASGVISAFNPSAEKIFQYRAHEVIGRNVSDLMPEPYRGHHDGYLKKYQETGRAKIIGRGREVLGLRKDGTTFPMDLSVSEMKVGDGAAYVGIVRDATERKEAEYALREQVQKTEQANLDLAQTVGELEKTNQQLSETQAQLVQSEKLASLGGMVAGIAHELNTPVGIGVTAASHLKTLSDETKQLMSDGALKRSSLSRYIESSADSAAMILKTLTRTSNLVESFKQIAGDGAESAAVTFNLRENLRHVQLDVTNAFADRSFDWDIHCGSRVSLRSYPKVVKQVLTRIFENAIAHAYEPDQTVFIRVEVNEHAGWVSIVISDNGKGIAEDLLTKIFDPFFTTARGVAGGGVGLGLAVAYNLVNATLGGRIHVSSSPGAGAAFRIDLPKTLE